MAKEAELDPKLYNAEGRPLYPKMVTDKDGNRVQVDSPDEEAKVAAPNKDKKWPTDNKPKSE